MTGRHFRPPPWRALPASRLPTAAKDPGLPRPRHHIHGRGPKRSPFLGMGWGMLQTEMNLAAPTPGRPGALLTSQMSGMRPGTVETLRWWPAFRLPAATVWLFFGSSVLVARQAQPVAAVLLRCHRRCQALRRPASRHPFLGPTKGPNFAVLLLVVAPHRVRLAPVLLRRRREALHLPD